MCANHTSDKNFLNTNILFAVAIALGILCGWIQNPYINTAANYISDVFINLLKLVSLPIIFLSLVSTAAGMDSVHEVKSIGKKVIKYTLMTTIVAAAVALGIFLLVDPVRTGLAKESAEAAQIVSGGYMTYLMQVVPDSFLKPFIENHVVGVLFMGMLLSLAILSLPDQNRTVLNRLFSSLFAAVMKITTWIIALMPIGVWSFIVLFTRDLQEGLEVKSLAFYLLCVVCANLVQAFIVLPLFLRWNRIPPLATFKAMTGALSVAFFAKSSSAAIPMAIRCAEQKLGMSKKVAGFVFPLCTTINMNGCAAFILTTVLFVSMSNGVTFTYPEMGVWVVIASIAALGNAGVPMGCYFLSSAILASMNVPLSILGIILPFYALIDMLESAINVWSDSCVAAIVQKEVAGEESVAAEEVGGETVPA